jgi:hypothetical protein
VLDAETAAVGCGVVDGAGVGLGGGGGAVGATGAVGAIGAVGGVGSIGGVGAGVLVAVVVVSSALTITGCTGKITNMTISIIVITFLISFCIFIKRSNLNLNIINQLFNY